MNESEVRELVIGTEPKTKKELYMHRILIVGIISYVLYNASRYYGII